MNKPPRGVQMGCGGCGDGAGGGGGLKTGAGTSASSKLPSVVPPETHVALAHRNDVPGMAHAHVPFDAAVRQSLSGTPGMSLGRNGSACATPAERPVKATLPASSAPAIVFFMTASFHFLLRK